MGVMTLLRMGKSCTRVAVNRQRDPGHENRQCPAAEEPAIKMPIPPQDVEQGKGCRTKHPLFRKRTRGAGS